MRCPANDNPTVRAEHFVDIGAGIGKCAGNILMVALGTREASTRRLVTVIDLVAGDDLIQDRLVLLVISIVKALNHIEIRFCFHGHLPRKFFGSASWLLPEPI